MHGGTVVPKHKVVGAPRVAVYKFGPRRVPAQIFDQRPAFFGGHAGEMPHFFTDVQGLASGFGMYANHRLCHRRIAPFHVRRAHRIINLARGGVHAVQVGDEFFHTFRQGVVGREHIGEHGVAADFGHPHGTQQGTQCRYQRERMIGMPHAAGIARIRRLAVGLWLGGDQQYFGVIGMAVLRRIVVCVERTEPAAEGNMLLGGERLVAKQHDAVFEQRTMNFPVGAFGQRRAQIDTGNFSTKSVGQAADGNSHVWQSPETGNSECGILA